MNLGEKPMLTTRRATRIAAIISVIAVLPNAGAAGDREQPDARERERRETEERRRAEIRASELEGDERRSREGEGDLERSVRELEARVEQLHEELNHLRLEEVDLTAELERMEIEGRVEEVHEGRRRLLDVQHELRRRELELDRHFQMLEREAERLELVRMTDRLEYVSNWRDVAFDAPRAVMMATQALVEMFVDRDQPERAADELGQLLERVEELGSRTAIRFALKDIYMIMEDSERAANQMKMVIVENSRALGD